MFKKIKEYIVKNWVFLALYAGLGLVIAKVPFAQWAAILAFVLAIDINSAIQARKDK